MSVITSVYVKCFEYGVFTEASLYLLEPQLACLVHYVVSFPLKRIRTSNLESDSKCFV